MAILNVRQMIVFVIERVNQCKLEFYLFPCF